MTSRVCYKYDWESCFPLWGPFCGSIHPIRLVLAKHCVRKTTIFAEGISACKGNAIHFIPFPCESVPLQTGPCPKCQNCPINENIETTNCVVYVLYDDYSISSLFLFVIVHVTVKAFQRTMSACRHCHRPKVLHRS